MEKMPLQSKIKCFKELNDVLLKMEKVRNRTNNNFYLNDFHEENILFNVETKGINIVDIDSCRILQNQPFPSKYLTPVSLSSYFPNKYKTSSNENGEFVIADENSDIYCYALIILNFLYKGKFYQLDLKTVQLYFEYLKEIGFSNEFIDIISKPFKEDCQNQLFGDYLDEINEERLEKASYPYFKKYVLKKY